VPRVLITDDEPAIRAMLARILVEHGFDVVLAVDGSDAIDQLRRHHFDLLLLDLMMPKLDGFGVLEKLDAAGIESPPVLVASAASPQLVRRLPEGSVAGVIAKPFDVIELVNRVRNLTEPSRDAV
jgi:DNA-binding response OmpR family regulator